jgi:hypothetical protein
VLCCAVVCCADLLALAAKVATQAAWREVKVGICVWQGRGWAQSERGGAAQVKVRAVMAMQRVFVQGERYPKVVGEESTKG